MAFAAFVVYALTRKKESREATLLERIRLIAIGEGVSSLLLLLAMPLKYAANWPAGVKAMGTAHGWMFIVYLIAVLAVFRPLRWGFGRLVLMLALGFIPLATFFIEPTLRREEQTAA